MALVLPNSVFVHVPRAGGQWFRKTVAASLSPGLRRRRRESDRHNAIAVYHCSYSELPIDFQLRPCFGFIRHPLPWLRSRWTHQRQFGISNRATAPIHKQFNSCWKPTFPATVESILGTCPGLVTKTFEYMLDGCTFIGRVEDFPRAPILILRMCNERFNVRPFLTTKPVNSTGSLPENQKDLHLPPSLQKEFLHSESAFISKWYGPDWYSPVRIQISS